MIKVTASEDTLFTLNAKIRAGVAVYLDNFAIKELAKGDPERRRRFVAAVHQGAEPPVLCHQRGRTQRATGRFFSSHEELLR